MLACRLCLIHIRKFNETTEVTINRLLNPSSSQDLNNICLYLKNLTHSEIQLLKIFNFPQVTEKISNDNNNFNLI